MNEPTRKLTVEVEVEARTDFFAARATGFPAFAYGKTEGEALERLFYGLSLLTKSMEKQGKLEKFLNERLPRNIQRHKARSGSPHQ